MNAETLIGRCSNLRAPSPTVIKLLNLLNRPDADYDEVIATVCRDAVLSAKLLGLCNSAAYGLAHPVSSIEQGVLYLGYAEIHRLTMAIGFGDQIGVELPGYDMDPGALWQHSIVVAQLTPRVVGLSKKFSVDTSIAYTAGLLHDIGKLLINQTLSPDMRLRIHELVELEHLNLLQAEQTVLGCDHAQVGGALLRKWKIPEVITEAVENHHRPSTETGLQLSTVVHVADAIAHQAGASPGWASLAVSVNDLAVTALGLAAHDIELLTFAAFDAQYNVASQSAQADRGGVVQEKAPSGAPAGSSF